jgi:hypothetical protein
MRVEPAAPYGEGGTLVVSLTPALCGQPARVLRVTREDVTGRARWNVFETPVGTPCKWIVADLWPGKYDVSVEGAIRHPVTLREFEITAGATIVESLDITRTEIAGLVPSLMPSPSH